MLLEVDKVNNEVKLPTGAFPVALNYSSEKLYYDHEKGLKHFKQVAGEEFLPRLGYLKLGDIFTTNCLAYDDLEFADDDAFWAAADAHKTTVLYGIACANGAIQITATSTGANVVVIDKGTMADGQDALKVQAL